MIIIFICRVESFIEHQDVCNMNKSRLETQAAVQAATATACLSRTASSPSSDTNFSIIPKATVTELGSLSNKLLHPNLELQLSTNTASNPADVAVASSATQLGERVKEEAREELRIAMAEKAYAEEARKQAKREIELAELEFTNAKRIRQQAQAQLHKAYALKEHAIKHINSTLLQITCNACHHQFHSTHDANSLLFSYIASEAPQLHNHHA